MKLLCISENLKKGILSAERIIGKNLTLPILSNILLEAERGSLRISATNLEIGIVNKVRAKIEKEGRVAIPGKIAANFISQIADGEKIAIESKGESVGISYGDNKTVIKGIDAKDFPIIPKAQSKPLFILDGLRLQEICGKILPCVAASETRQELAGVFVGLGEKNIEIAATDSFRLAEGKIILKKEDMQSDYSVYRAKNNALIIPARTIAEVIRNLGGEGAGVRVYLGENQIFFETEGSLLVSRLIDGRYPEYKQVVPHEFSSSIITDREALLKAVKMASIFSDNKSREVKFGVKSAEKKIVIEAQSVESGENITEVEGQIAVKNDSVIAFNNKFLIDALNLLSSPKIYVGFNDSFGPVIFREINSDDKVKDDYFHIVMPIRS
ncbi:MAG: DNA polymerase III subunit beta [Parcubacteria group bacterium]|jgi:DNA polymerase-3 subunit beta